MEKKAESVSWDKNIGLSPPTSEIWDNVIALSPPTSSSNPWGDMSIQGNGSKVAQIKFDRHDIISAKLDLYASGHGCEEFWYSNVPDDVGEQYGICGGGTYREIRLTVDGFLAGILYPFPVVYTGGINPLLWRPMTGIQSFNIPPYSFDLTPFVGSWNSNNRVDDETHTFEITVYGNNDQGSWFVDPVLLLNYYDLETVPSPLCHGDILDFYNSPPDVDVTKVSALTYETTGIDYYMVYGIVYTPDSSKMLNYQVTGNFTSSNYNDYGNGVTYGQMDQQVESAYFIYHYSDDDDDADWVWTSNMQIYSYPYSITLDDTSNDDYLYIHASVNYSCHKQGLFNWVTFQGYSDSINTTAVYNRSNDILRTMNEETNHALQRFHMIPSTDSTSPSTSCFDLLINAVNGSTSNKDSSDNNCENVIDLCSTYDACVLSPISPQQHGHKHEKKKHSTEELLFRVPSSYTFRNLKEQYN